MLRISVAVALILVGAFRTIATPLLIGLSAERRSAIAKRASEIDIVADVRAAKVEMPTVPRNDNITNSPGTNLSYRIPLARSPVWRFFTTASISTTLLVATTVLGILSVESIYHGPIDGLMILCSLGALTGTIGSVHFFVLEIAVQIGISPETV